MSVVIRSSSKSDSTNINLLQNSRTVPDLYHKVQPSYTIEATICETRPGGVVILATPKGLVRSTATIPLEEGDKVLARLSKNEEGDIKAYVISKVDHPDLPSKIDKLGTELLNKYIFQAEKKESMEVDHSKLFTARVSYVASNRNTLLYGNINSGDEVTIQLLSPKASARGLNAIVGEVLGNSHNSVMLNSSLGMLNIEAKSNLAVGDKILFRLVNVPNTQQQVQIKESISNIINMISSNIAHFKLLLEEMAHLEDDNNYTRFLQLAASSEAHTITLARLFHNARNVPSDEVERWIEEEIVEPFEASSKSNPLSTLCEDISQIAKHFVNLKIIPEVNQWQVIELPIPGTKKEAKMRVKRAKDNIITFMIDIDHEAFGRMNLQGSITPATPGINFPILNINIKCNNPLPQGLQNAIASSFANHKVLSAIDGEIVFEDMIG